MPELPEVEVTRRELSPHLLGRVIERARTTGPSYFFLTTPRTLSRRLRGRRVESLERRGKYLLLGLEGGARLLLHLGMTGQLFFDGASSVRLLSSTAAASLAPEVQARFTPDAHTHLTLEFEDDGPRLFFRDVRKFGKVEWLPAGESCARLDKLGVDALEATGANLHAAAKKRRAPIKSVLLDQRVLAGVGNIYADEALFLAGVRPDRAANRVSRARCDAIVEAAQCVMLRSIETGGSSISDYVRPGGEDGGYQDERHVYGREGEDCPTCGALIRKTSVGQRGTHYCPRCQR
ncbi:MAG: bifunctional DNA-formamidopyrimidine glycosylase/DNA-(apurinic or apyrimidinic site) lyase [Deltaproteobacteria bacterium]|nr:bifunctional DNA-formamidopyrimidine glycosylase/DNA-(apurinic or apyrimidinic site) lyase [Deltaproteobacteria bacterium]